MEALGVLGIRGRGKVDRTAAPGGDPGERTGD